MKNLHLTLENKNKSLLQSNNEKNELMLSKKQIIVSHISDGQCFYWLCLNLLKNRNRFYATFYDLYRLNFVFSLIFQKQ